MQNSKFCWPVSAIQIGAAKSVKPSAGIEFISAINQYPLSVGPSDFLLQGEQRGLLLERNNEVLSNLIF